MINRSPWLWGVRKTAAGLTGRTSLGIQILQGKRAKGQSNPSDAYIQAQNALRILTSINGKIATIIRNGFTQLMPGWSGYSAFTSYGYANAIDLSAPPDATLIDANLLVTKGSMTPTPLTSAPTA